MLLNDQLLDVGLAHCNVFTLGAADACSASVLFCALATPRLLLLAAHLTLLTTYEYER